MERKFLTTGDGSLTIHLPEWDEQYHSKHGAINEARHVFIKEGLHHWVSSHNNASLAILEIGFGTGLNAFLTFQEAQKNNFNIHYVGVEGYPLPLEEINKLNYPELLNFPKSDFLKLHDSPWDKLSAISQNFFLLKQQRFFLEINETEEFDLIYFDAFGIRVQPELWTESIFQKMFTALKNGGMLVTYAANGNARRAMQAVGFSVERLAGPPGKKEMLRGTKK
ncbi:tRNA (5-methylaminomethyl-2-thiouridine)(34)-methyltransferase MnmD [Aequorivita echinoideorum]|uniref:tRNA (5-methylaminomethyl-2-thiouridine)(34)-methyltransferase MnmD n=1 Tax=Aequorivita echinoideorum TaxID=1549647 RepID=A0ABS5S5J8_9FLAO|nr:tRNA (5-methylaminomethyl-2-thiouridine)(34)-methyltransferase MnmD [Aequorivita echinoideorum]MBT0608253.1 tRNA (5-methylaminomethyl-2-thiouridine)(34)-methyltransferase MnmD [Aequorivita echinoideorum]